MAIGSKNLDLTAGLIRGGVQEMSIRSNNRGTTTKEIGNIILRTSRSGETIRIVDVADVQIGYNEASQESEYNGNPTVSFQIEKQQLTRIFLKLQRPCTTIETSLMPPTQISSWYCCLNSMTC